MADDKNDGFATDKQRRWFFANHPDAAASRITPSVPPNIGGLIKRREAEVRSGQLAENARLALPENVAARAKQTAMPIEWSPTPRKPWRVLTPQGRVIKQFDTADQASAYRDKMMKGPK